jgi:hypothetical protein
MTETTGSRQVVIGRVKLVRAALRCRMRRGIKKDDYISWPVTRPYTEITYNIRYFSIRPCNWSAYIVVRQYNLWVKIYGFKCIYYIHLYATMHTVYCLQCIHGLKTPHKTAQSSDVVDVFCHINYTYSCKRQINNVIRCNYKYKVLSIKIELQFELQLTSENDQL